MFMPQIRVFALKFYLFIKSRGLNANILACHVGIAYQINSYVIYLKLVNIWLS